MVEPVQIAKQDSKVSNTSFKSSQSVVSKKRTMAQITKPDPNQVQDASSPVKKQGTKVKRVLTDKRPKRMNDDGKEEQKKKNVEEVKEEAKETEVTLTQQQRLHKLTGYTAISVCDFAIIIKKEIEEAKTRRPDEEVICPICQCEMFDDVKYQD